MPNNRNTTPASDFRETVCVNVDRIYDCCKDRDCMQDLRVYLPEEYQEILDNAVSIKPGCAEILWSYIDVEPLAFNNGFYTVDIQFFIRVSFDVCTGQGRPQRIEGCASFSKKTILYGSEGEARIYTSEYAPQGCDRNPEVRSNRPRATVEVLDPIVLSAHICEPCDPCGCDNLDVSSIPGYICACFGSAPKDNEGCRKLYVTLGLFSIVRLMREVQLLIPACDFCIPEKESCYPSEEDPCGLFGQMEFPLDQFFPPNRNGNCADTCDN
ncbi:MAG: hypothetical protein J6C26_08155 [Clostridia bacterium]|nr:hypothetical protein [Clostridia bacterium]